MLTPHRQESQPTAAAAAAATAAAAAATAAAADREARSLDLFIALAQLAADRLDAAAGWMKDAAELLHMTDAEADAVENDWLVEDLDTLAAALVWFGRVLTPVDHQRDPELPALVQRFAAADRRRRWRARRLCDRGGAGRCSARYGRRGRLRRAYCRRAAEALGIATAALEALDVYLDETAAVAALVAVQALGALAVQVEGNLVCGSDRQSAAAAQAFVERYVDGLTAAERGGGRPA